MNESVRVLLEKFGISAALTQHVLDISDQGRLNPSPIQVSGIPGVDDPRIVDISKDELSISLKSNDLLEQLSQLDLTESKSLQLLKAVGIEAIGQDFQINQDQLHRLGILLTPLVSLGILNGGSASSYFDLKKNQEFNPWLFGNFSGLIEEMSKRWAHLPKALSPAFISQASPADSGFSFLHLKLRAWLLQIQQFQQASSQLGFSLPWAGLEREMPVFQMVSQATQAAIAQEFSAAMDSPLLKNLTKQCGISLNQPLSATQAMIAAFTQALPDGHREIFCAAFGQTDRPLALPGGHGQNFHVLAQVYQTLLAGGKKLAYLGNIDNLGFVPDPIAIAVTAILPCQASFEFAHKTALDRKGGILVQTAANRLTCGDIGQAVSPALVAEAEGENKEILFNCATGLFKLDYLVPHLAEISRNLPLRFSNQEKDAGRYSQAEQTTWEVIGLLDAPLILGVQKQERFLAAKLCLDCIITSGLANELEPKQPPDREILQIGTYLHQGLRNLLQNRYGLGYSNQTWQVLDY